MDSALFAAGFTGLLLQFATMPLFVMSIVSTDRIF
jgi:hypothetical protein